MKMFVILFAIGCLILLGAKIGLWHDPTVGTGDHAECQLGTCKYQDKYGKVVKYDQFDQEAVLGPGGHVFVIDKKK